MIKNTLNILHKHVEQLFTSAAVYSYSDLNIIFILYFHTLSSVSNNKTLILLTYNRSITILLHDLTHYFFNSMHSINTASINTSYSQTLTLIYNYTDFLATNYTMTAL